MKKMLIALSHGVVHKLNRRKHYEDDTETVNNRAHFTHHDIIMLKPIRVMLSINKTPAAMDECKNLRTVCMN